MIVLIPLRNVYSQDVYKRQMLVQHLVGYIPEDREEKTRDFFDLNLKLAYDFPIFKSVTLQVDVYKRQVLTPVSRPPTPFCRYG